MLRSVFRREEELQLQACIARVPSQSNRADFFSREVVECRSLSVTYKACGVSRSSNWGEIATETEVVEGQRFVNSPWTKDRVRVAAVEAILSTVNACR